MPHPSHHQCLGTQVSCQCSSSAFSSLGSVSPSRVSLSPITVSPPFPGSPSLQLPLLPPLGWLPFCPQLDQALISLKVRGRPGLFMPISPQGSRSWSCVHLSLSDHPQRPPAPTEGVHSRSRSPNLPPASLLILLVTLTSHLLSSLPPATMPAYILTPMPAPLSPPPMAKEELVRPGEAPSDPPP